MSSLRSLNSDFYHLLPDHHPNPPSLFHTTFRLYFPPRPVKAPTPKHHTLRDLFKTCCLLHSLLFVISLAIYGPAPMTLHMIMSLQAFSLYLCLLERPR